MSITDHTPATRHCCITCGPGETRLVADAPHPAVQCVKCGLVYELKVSENPLSAYEDEKYDSVRDQGEVHSRWRRYHHDCAVAHDRLTQLTPIVGEAKDRLWIDVGANNGAFLVVARRSGWRSFAVESTPSNCANITNLFGIPATSYGTWVIGALGSQTLPTGTVISLFDVLEHLLDPAGFIRAASCYLRVGGYLVVEVPDFATATALRDWKHRRITDKFTEHQWHFRIESLTAMVAKFAPELSRVLVSNPVPGKLQMVWKNDGVAQIDELLTTLKQQPEPSRTAALKALSQTHPEIHRRVAERLVAVGRNGDGHGS